MHDSSKLKKELKEIFDMYQVPNPPTYNELIKKINKSDSDKILNLYGIVDYWYSYLAGYVSVLLKDDKITWENKTLLKEKLKTIQEIDQIKNSLKKRASINLYLKSLLIWWDKIKTITDFLIEYRELQNKKKFQRH